MGRRIGVIYGGWGEEREISLVTGEAVARTLEQGGHPVVRIDAAMGLDRALRAARIDVAFLALHGRLGEDGCVQGLLEVLGIPYTGSGVLASALAMDKPMAKQLFALHGLATPRGYAVSKVGPEVFSLHGDLGFPVVVKPARGGSSVGLSIVTRPEELLPALDRALALGGGALVERQVIGREVTVGILGGHVLGSLEVEHGGAGGFDFTAKYRSSTARYFLPPRLSSVRVTNVESMALAAYRALGCRGAARVDLICTENDNEQLLEVNTLPGLTPHSLLPKIAARAGYAFGELLESMVLAASLDHPRRRPSPPLRAAS